MTALASPTLSLLAVLTLQSVAASRDSVSFDFGWKHRTGLHDWAPAGSEPPKHPDPGLAPPESAAKFDDAGWADVQLPHDGLIANNSYSDAACPNGCSGHSFIPRRVLWYRKEFTLPSSWKGSAVWLDFEGSFRNTTVWINGALAAQHDCGYTPFRVRLDNLTSVAYGAKSTVAVYVDPDNGDLGGRESGSGWWYEGGGLYRPVHLVRASPVHIEQDGLFAYSNVSLANAGDAASATVHASAAVVNTGAAADDVCVTFSIAAPDGAAAAPPPPAVPLTIAAGASAVARATIAVAAPRLWSSASPTLYSVSAAVGACGGDGGDRSAPAYRSSSAAAADALTVPHGFRTLRYDADDGFFLNEEHFKVRGFCDHTNFAVVGMAVPPRVNLFRAQASRAVGGNGRRTSHNPPDRGLLEIYDRVGITVMDENRLFANESKYVTNMGALVKRDRNHPAVVIWSFCNEAGCEGEHEAGGPSFREIAYEFDGSRPTLANMFTFGDLLSNTIDVQGFSHQDRKKLDDCHAKLPHKPIYMSECCSCNTYRDEDIGCETLHDNPHSNCTQISFNARCAESNSATNASDAAPYAVGTMVWTLFDYYGEPPVGGASQGLEVSSTYGQYDLCGFPKAASFWYRTQWLLTVKDGPDKTFPTGGKHEVRIVESWESPDSWPETKGNATRAIHAYTSAPTVELVVNGKSVGARSVRPMVEGPGSYAEWTAVPFAAGSITAVARDAKGAEVARHTVHTSRGAAVGLALTIDAPHATTGTGAALLLDGQDAALLRATLVDAAGRRAPLATHNVSFRIVSGPGRVQGAHNGDPRNHEPNDAPWHSAYHGLVRAVVRVTSTAGRDPRERSLLAQIDARGPMAAAAAAGGGGGAAAAAAAEPIIVEATADGFAPARVSIPTSADASAAGVLAAAAAAAGKAVDFFGGSDGAAHAAA